MRRFCENDSNRAIGFNGGLFGGTEKVCPQVCAAKDAWSCSSPAPWWASWASTLASPYSATSRWVSLFQPSSPNSRVAAETSCSQPDLWAFNFLGHENYQNIMEMDLRLSCQHCHNPTRPKSDWMSLDKSRQVWLSLGQDYHGYIATWSHFLMFAREEERWLIQKQHLCSL